MKCGLSTELAKRNILGISTYYIIILKVKLYKNTYKSIIHTTTCYFTVFVTVQINSQKSDQKLYVVT